MKPRGAAKEIPVLPPRLLVVVPAHDEEELIEACVRSIIAQEYADGQIDTVVVADNCSDATASRAAAAGAQVLQRRDPTRIGKPAALAWTLEQINLARYDALVVVDADSRAAPGFATGLAAAGLLRQNAAQAYLGTLNEYDNWLTRLGGLFARARYEVTYPTRARSGVNVPLAGNGMCIGVGLLETGWRDFSLTEDLELYARLTAAGVQIRYASQARIEAQEARTLRQSGGQRQRWARGRWSVLRDYAGAIVRSRPISAIQKVDALAELALPSPILRLLIAVAVASAALVFFSAAEQAIAVSGALMFVLPDLWATTVTLARHPQRIRTLGALAVLPWYAAWRALVGARGLVVVTDAKWTRTPRNRSN